ncbi:MAG: ABC transporter ATP-binding protein [Bacteroidetes bacterium]|nr:ABC transporter ATP-binding protein [Bacteroidota bacterium]
MLTEPLLDLQKLKISFKSPFGKTIEAVRGIDLSIQRGEVLGIIGESGSGKSVTFLSLMKLLSPNATVEGKAFFNFKDNFSSDLFALKPQELRKLALRNIAYIFQDPLAALNPSLRIGKQMTECILEKINSEQKKIKCLQILEDVMPGLSERAYNSFPHQLSGGQRQRVMIAMAMLNKPDLLIADEPTTALDPEVQDNILNLLLQMVRKYGTTLILISHDIRSVADFCDRIAVFYQGKMVELGTKNDIVSKPHEPYTKALLSCRPNQSNQGFYLSTIKDFMQNEVPAPQKFPDLHISENSLLDAIDVSQVYNKKFKALEPVTLRIKKGECIGIIGESGSGKSTFAKILVHLEKPNSGTLVYADTLTPSKVQMVFQDPFASLNPAIPVGDAIDEILKIHQPQLNKRERQNRIFALLKETGVDESLSNKKPAAFSGGQRQRICIARALAAEPEILVCDEAVSALDISVQAQVLNLLKRLQFERGLSLVFITHDMNVAKHICNRILILKNGQLVEQGETAELFENPQNSYTKKILSYYQA